MNIENRLKNKIIETATNYFKDDSKKELLKNKDYETISNELVEELFKNQKQPLKNLKILLKKQFIEIIKKYVENNEKVN